MSDPIYPPRRRSHRDAIVDALPHPGETAQLKFDGSVLVNGKCYVTDLACAKKADLQAQDELLQLLRDCLTKGYQSAMADMRRLLDQGN